MAGLVFSIIGQYTGELYSLDPAGKISKDVLIIKMHDRHSVEIIASILSALTKGISLEITEMKEERNDLNKELLSEMKADYKCVRNAENALAKCLRQFSEGHLIMHM